MSTVSSSSGHGYLLPNLVPKRKANYAASSDIDDRDLLDSPGLVSIPRKTQYYNNVNAHSKPRNEFGDSDNDNFSHNVAHIIRRATKADLLEHQNHAYAQLLSAYNVLKEQRNFIPDVMQRLDNLTDIISSLSTGSIGLALPIPSADLSGNKPCQEDYPNVTFWHRYEWDAYVEEAKFNGVWRQANTKDDTCDALGFITNPNGISINGHQASVIRQSARQLWHSLAKVDSDPPTWGSADASAVKFFRSHMYKEYPDLRLCENDWKVDMIAQKDYPSWYKAHRSEKPKKSSTQVKRSISESPEPADTIPRTTKPNGIFKKVKIRGSNPKPNPNLRMNVTGAASAPDASVQNLSPGPPPTHKSASLSSSKLSTSSFDTIKTKLTLKHTPITNASQPENPTAVNPTFPLKPRPQPQIAVNVTVTASAPSSTPSPLAPSLTHVDAPASSSKPTLASTIPTRNKLSSHTSPADPHPSVPPATNGERSSSRTTSGPLDFDVHHPRFPITNPFSKKTTETSSAPLVHGFHAPEQPTDVEEAWEETSVCRESVAVPEVAVGRQEEEPRQEEIEQMEEQHLANTNSSIPSPGLSQPHHGHLAPTDVPVIMEACESKNHFPVNTNPSALPQHHNDCAPTGVPAMAETCKSKNRRNDDGLFKYNKNSNSPMNLFGFDYLKEHLGAKPTNAVLSAAYNALPPEKQQEYEARRLENLRRKHA